MPKKKIENGKLGIIPKVDMLKADFKPIDVYGDIETEDGYRITRSAKGEQIRKEYMIKELTKQEKAFNSIKKEVESYMDKDEVKDVSKKLKKKKKKGKDGKKKKNKSGEEKNVNSTYLDSLINAMPSDLSDYIKDGGKKGEKKKKKKEKKKQKKLESMEGLTIKKKKKKDNKKKEDSEKKKKETSEVAERFKEVEKITRENIKEIDNTISIVDERIREITKTNERIRGKDTALANYINARSSLISTRQKAATDILSNRAKVYDIEMKKERAGNADSASDADIISKIFPGIALNGKVDASLKDYVKKNGKNKDKDGKKKKYKDADMDDLLIKREKDLLKSGDINYSSYDKNIEWEGRFNVAIKKSWSDNSWKFIAIDDDGNVLKDVPKSMLPSKKTVQLTFDDERDCAIDRNTNTMYQVLQVPSL